MASNALAFWHSVALMLFELFISASLLLGSTHGMNEISLCPVIPVLLIYEVKVYICLSGHTRYSTFF